MKLPLFLILILPVSCFAQFTITGKVLSKADKKPVENVSVFLSNATVGDKTEADGSFTLRNVKPGKYDLVVTDIAFETYSETVIVENTNIRLPDILLAAQTRALKEVTIKYHADPNRERYYNWFKDEFLGTSALAKDCKILNPDVLDLNYDEDTHTLTASSYDFLLIENSDLGYRIKYLLTDFSLKNKDSEKKEIYYKGPVLFEQLKGSPSDSRYWERNRQKAYENSAFHFLRAALSGRIEQEGFRVQRLAIYSDPARPADSLINARIKFFKNIKHRNAVERDSLAWWDKKLKMPKIVQKLMPYALTKQDIITTTGQRGQYALGCENDGLLVGYSPNGHFHLNDHFDYLYNPGNNENTLIMFNSPDAFFYSNCAITNPYSVLYYGVWGRNRVAELLPVDYEPPHTIDMPTVPANDGIVAKLDSFSTAHPAEKAYLQFDKPYYAAGDTMYFKAYVTMGERHLLSAISGVLHVDLINTANKIDQSIKLRLADGVAWGDFALPDSLPKGNYRVRAWTQWMRNDSNFFEKVVPVGSLQNTKVTESGRSLVAVNVKPDMQFFPEGGNLVTGVKSKVAFKAIGTNGLGMAVSGEVLDNDNKQVTTFASVHQGMGSFAFVPEPGKMYRAELTFANGAKQTIDLPKAEEKGITLSVNNDSIPVAKVRIEANQTFFKENKGRNYTLLIYSGGIATTVPCSLDSTVISLDILKRKLFTGITRITLFSPNNEPLCERLIFVQNYDQLSLNVSMDQATHAPREKVILKLNAKTRADSAATGHFSISVTDESKVPADENNETTILTNLLLTSDLKGYIEQPNYYFNHINDATAKNLDLVMLTHGYRRFEWKQVLNKAYPPLDFQPENSITISGTAKSLLGKPVVHGTVSLISTMGGPVLSQTTDDKGNFSFTGLNITDTARFVLQAVTDKGKNSTQLTYKVEKPPLVATNPSMNSKSGPDTLMMPYLENSEKQQEELNRLGMGKGRMLKEVKIRAFKEDNNYRSSSLLGPGHADQVIHAAEIENMGGSLSDRLNGKLIGIRFLNPQNGPGGVPYLSAPPDTNPMLVVIDGVPQEGTTMPSINIINPSNVETVEVLRFASTSIYGMEGGNGVIVITTKQGKGLDPKDIASIGILPINVQGFYKAREFYTPKYEHPNNNTNFKDLRSTIYWQSELATDKEGNASIDFYNADGTGNYRVVIEGIDAKGNIGRLVYRYKVE